MPVSDPVPPKDITTGLYAKFSYSILTIWVFACYFNSKKTTDSAANNKIISKCNVSVFLIAVSKDIPSIAI